MRLSRAFEVRLIQTLFFSSTIISLASAVFQHEAFKTDWQHSLLGPPVKNGVFFTTTSLAEFSVNSTKVLFALGDRNVLGAIQPADGKPLWRRAFDENNRLVITNSDKGVVVGRDDATEEYSTDGALLWSNNDKAIDVASAGGFVYILGDDSVKKVDKGYTVWETSLRYDSTSDTHSELDLIWTGSLGIPVYTNNLDFLDSSATLTKVAVSDTEVFAISLIPGKPSAIRVNVLNILTGKNNWSYEIGGGVDGPKCSGCIVFVGGKVPIIAWKDAAYENLKVNVLGYKSVLSSPIEVPADEKLKSVSVHVVESEGHAAIVHYATEEHSWTRQLSFDGQQNQMVNGVISPKRAGKVTCTTASTPDGQSYVIRVTPKHLSVLDKNLVLVSEWSIPTNQTFTNPIQATAEIVKDNSGNLHARAAVLTSDGEWVMIQDGKRVWARPEYLAWTVSAVLADRYQEPDLVRELEIEGEASLLDAYIHRLRRHLLRLQENLIPWITTLPERIPELISYFLSLNAPNNAEKFGYDKIAVLATKFGRIAGLSYGNDGVVVWNTDLRTVEPHADWSSPKVAVIAPGVVAIRSAGKDGKVGNVVHLSVSNGQPLMNEDVTPFSVALVSRLLKQENADVVRYNITDGGLTVKGYRESDIDSHLWSFAPPPGEVIASVQQRPPHDPTASIGRTLSDRTVLYKYLNLNVLLITSISHIDQTVTFTVLDGVSGRVLVTATHESVDTTLPVVSIARENWIATSFTHVAAKEEQEEGGDADVRSIAGTVLTFTELYDSAVSNDRGPFGDSNQNASVLEQPDFPNPNPHVKAAMFMVSGNGGRPISSLSSSVTQQGITARQLLALSSDGTTPATLHAIPIAFLDPRRPVGREATSEEASEGLLKYSPILHLLPGWSLTHRRELLVPQTGGPVIRARQTALESTSVILLAGLDVFGTRSAPSGGFDYLPTGEGGFDMKQVIGTIAGLIIAVAIFGPRVASQRVSRNWGL